MINGPPKKRSKYTRLLCIACILLLTFAGGLRHQSVLGVTIHQHEIVAMQCLDVLSEEKSMKVTFQVL